MFSSSVHSHEIWQNSHQTSSLDQHNICKRFLKMLTINPLVWPQKKQKSVSFLLQIKSFNDFDICVKNRSNNSSTVKNLFFPIFMKLKT